MDPTELAHFWFARTTVLVVASGLCIVFWFQYIVVIPFGMHFHLIPDLVKGSGGTYFLENSPRGVACRHQAL